MSVKIHGAEHPLKEIFSDLFVFEIPPYQRPYSWTTEHAGELFEDILNAMQDGGSDGPDPYFLGSIVLAKEESEPSAKVIDGQQRLTTLTILLSALAAHAEGKRRDEIREFILQEGSDLKQTRTVYRLTLRPRDAEFFQDRVQEPGGFEDLLKLDRGQLTDPEANIQENAALFMERLGALSSTERSALASYLVNHCFLVAVSTPDRDSAFRIFAVLNDRGLDLSHADIIKSEVVGEIPEEQQTQYTTIWEEAEEDLGIEAFADLFSHIRMIYAKTKQRETLIKEFKEHVLPKIQDQRNFVDDVISPYGDVYARILTQSWESTSRAEEINWTLGWLERIDNFDWIPPAIRYLNEHQHDSAQVAEFLQGLERLAASMFIRRVNINGRIDRYAKLLREIESGTDTLAAGSALDLTEDEKAETIDRLGGPIYDIRRTRSYVLLRLDEALSDGGAKYDYERLTVEHVLPQHPRHDSNWIDLFTDEQRDRWVHKLANLVLLTRRRNSSAQNYDFDTKKRKYFSDSEGTSAFVITTQVLERDAWTPEVLEERQQRQLEKLKDVWRLHPVQSQPSA